MGNYISASDVKSYSRITYSDLGYSSDTEFDTFLDDLITQIEAVIDEHCNVPSGFFKAGGLSFTEQYDYDESFIRLKHYPVLSVSSVYYNTAGYGQTESWSEVTSTYYILYSDEGLIKIINKVPAIKEKSIKITYTAGYSAVPDAIKHVAVQLCSNFLHAILQRKISPVVRVDEFTIKMIIPEIFTEELKMLLEPHVRHKVFSG